MPAVAEAGGCVWITRVVAVAALTVKVALVELFHPLALAKVLCEQHQVIDLAKNLLRELRYPALPLCPHPDSAAQEAERFTRILVHKALERFLQRSHLSPAELLQPPSRADQSCRSFCPRCLTQFTETAGQCADCGGLALVPFAVCHS